MPKVVDHDAYRAELVEHAIRLFVEHGYAGVGMRELAAAAGVSKSALYHYFPSKEALFRAVVEHVVAADVASIQAQVVPGASFAQRRDAFLAYVLEQEGWFQDQFAILVDHARAGELPEGSPMRAVPQQYIDAIAAFLGISSDEAQAVYFQLDGVLMQRWFDGGITDLAEALRWTLDRIAERHGERDDAAVRT